MVNLKMPLQSLRHTSLALLISSIGLAPAQAMSLGELQLQSFVGQHFRASVPYKLNAGEFINNSCIEILQSRGDLPSIGSASVSSLAHSEFSGELLIESRDAIGEPTIVFGLKVACNGQNITRDYTAFLNIAPTQLPRMNERVATRQPQELAPLRDPKLLLLKKPQSLSQLAKRYYPVNTPQYPRYLQKLSNANPDLDPERELASGTSIVIPELLRSSRKKTTAPEKSGRWFEIAPLPWRR